MDWRRRSTMAARRRGGVNGFEAAEARSQATQEQTSAASAGGDWGRLTNKGQAAVSTKSGAGLRRAFAIAPPSSRTAELAKRMAPTRGTYSGPNLLPPAPTTEAPTTVKLADATSREAGAGVARREWSPRR